MAGTKTAAKKVTKPTNFKWTFKPDGTYTFTPNKPLKNGDIIEIVSPVEPELVCFDVTAKAKVMGCSGGGGPITVHS